MRTAEYTEEQIIEAGKNLMDSGKRVTPFGIRNALGGGNPSRIRAIWEAYKAGNVEHTPEVDQPVELPAEFAEQLEGMVAAMSDNFLTLAKRLYRRADEITENRTREAMQAAKSAQEQAEADIAEAERTIEQQDQTRDELEQRYIEIKDKNRAYEVEIARLADQVKHLRSQVAAAEQSIKENQITITDQVSVINRKEKELTVLQTTAAVDKKHFETEKARLSAELDQARTALDDLQADKQSMAMELGELRTKTTYFSEQHTKDQTLIKNLQKESDENPSD